VTVDNGLSWNEMSPELQDIGSDLRDAIRTGTVRSALLIAPPGHGKTMLARGLAGAIPLPMKGAELTDAMAIYRLAGMDGSKLGLTRPFRAPHCTASVAGMVGHGWRPGELSLAHGGMLFLDELPDFTRSAMDAVKYAMTNGEIVLGGRPPLYLRALPARFVLVAAMNPCLCGRAGAKNTYRSCECSPEAIRKYMLRVNIKFDMTLRWG